jgi:hypothetical protein
MPSLLAQSSTSDVWTFPPPTLLGWFGFICLVIVSTAGLVKAVRYLAHQLMEANRWGFGRSKEKRRVEAVINDLASRDGWPNGSKSLKESHSELYRRMVRIDNKMTELDNSVNELTRTVERVVIPLIRPDPDDIGGNPV